MFIADRMYTGAKANQMVSHMVETYKAKIDKLRNRNSTLEETSQALRQQVVDQDQELIRRASEIERLRNRYPSLREEELEQENRELRNQLRDRTMEQAKIQRKLDRAVQQLQEYRDQSWRMRDLSVANVHLQEALDRTKGELGRSQKINRDLAATVALRNSQLSALEEKLERFQQRKSENDSHWVNKVSLRTYDISPTVQIVFTLCTDEDGQDYIDARKYYSGRPTRKGICILVDDFEDFVNECEFSFRKANTHLANRRRGYGKNSNSRSYR